MKIIVTHVSPDMDAITSVWVIKKFLPGWENAQIQFVPAGERIGNIKSQISNLKYPIENIDGNEVMHVDTGMGPLDHHQTSDDTVCAASRSWEFVKENAKITPEHKAAIDRMVQVIIGYDHFKEVYYEDATADYHEFELISILDGLKLQKPDQDTYYVEFVSESLDALMHEFANRIWAEKEIQERGVEFATRFGKGIGFETINDTVIKLAQKMGYVLVVRKDPRKGYVRIKARPIQRLASSKLASSSKKDINLTNVYEKLKKIDPDATWFLHVSKKMLLNGSVKNPKMKPTKLTLQQLIDVLKGV